MGEKKDLTEKRKQKNPVVLNTLPKWVDYILLPFINLSLAFLVSGLAVLLMGENPIEFMKVLIYGAFGYSEGIGFTIFYATNYIFTAMAVALPMRCGYLNIGGQGQLYVAGLGVTIICLTFYGTHWAILLPFAIILSCVFGGIWGFIPGWLQAKRGSHSVITTIMFNFIAASLMSYLIVEVFTPKGHISNESRTFDENSVIPKLHTVFNDLFGMQLPDTPANISFFLAIFICILFWFFVWKTRWGYSLRVVGQSEKAAVYAGMTPSKYIIFAFTAAGAVAGLAAINIVMGEQYRLIQGFPSNYGFEGIATAFMGRHHPIGIFVAAFLFGTLKQGGSELDFEMPMINSDMIIFIQGLVILFCGALEFMLRPRFQKLFAKT